ncbi:phage tail protein I [Methylosinus sp. Sm6]|uniref:phage tail protein I n=1 Tax=Methylosinus sp. Sm6 TaxID=2866948 RepID=UPI001C9A1FC2|nr:phage tail protein I [Methylosinus sp. Sm6]MBY6239806.1 phage tail protein I [Methylosinus sp. Sm6]
MTDSLLPDPTPWERAVEATSAARWDLPAETIAALARAADCPPALIGYLAFARSVDLWRDDWPIERKRAVTQRALLDQGLKGTLALHERYLGYVDAELLHAVTPPARFALGRRLTPAETDAMLAGMPEIRIKVYADARAPGRRMFFGQHYFSSGGGWSAAGGDAVHESRATLLRDGVETLLRIADVTPEGADASLGAFSRLYLPHAWSAARVLGRGQLRRQRYWGRSRATQWVVSFVATGDALSRSVSPGLYPAAVSPRRVMAPHAASRGKAWWSYRSTWRRWFRPSDGQEHVYDSLRLWDESVSVARRRKRSFWSLSWRGMPTHSAVLSIDASRPAKKRKRWRGGGFSGFYRAHDARALVDALEAVRAASLPHETILVDLETAFQRRFYGA